jgi:hypothetical protein
MQRPALAVLIAVRYEPGAGTGMLFKDISQFGHWRELGQMVLPGLQQGRLQYLLPPFIPDEYLLRPRRGYWDYRCHAQFCGFFQQPFITAVVLG